MTLRVIGISNFIVVLALSASATIIVTTLVFGYSENIDFKQILIVESIVTAAWIVCGILAYGLRKNFWKLLLAERQCPAYNREMERLCVSIGINGALGLIGAFIDHRKAKYPIGLCFKMPQQLCAPFPKGKIRK